MRGKGLRISAAILLALGALCGLPISTRELHAQPRDAGIPSRGVRTFTVDLDFGRVQLDLDATTGTPLSIFPETRPPLSPPLTTETEAAEAAAQLINGHPELFRAGTADLARLAVHSALGGRAWRITTWQVHEGRRVLGSHLGIVLTTEGQLGWLTARLYPASGLEALPLGPAVASEEAVQAALLAQEGGVEVDSVPEEVVAFRGDAPVVAWQVKVGDLRSSRPEAPDWLYVVAADNREVLASGPLFVPVDLNGDVKARGTDPASLLPDVPYNPPTTQYFPLADLTVDLVNLSYLDETDAQGLFRFLGVPINTNLTARAQARGISGVTTTLFEVLPLQGLAVVDTVQTTCSSSSCPYVELRLNDSPGEFSTSQINAYVWARKSRVYADYLYTASGLSVPRRQVDMRVNDPNLPCNGLYHPDVTPHFANFGAARTSSPACANAAYSTVVAHEFGHHFTREVQIAVQNHSFGANTNGNKEGCADVFATFLTSQPRVAQDLFVQGQALRDVSQLVVFPSSMPTQPHQVGLSLAGSFWDLRTNLQAAEGYTGVVVAEILFAEFVEATFRDIAQIPELDERVGEALVGINLVKFGGFYKSHIVTAFLPHNLYRLKFIRGDANGSGAVDVSDVVYLSNYVQNGSPDPPCLDACDVDDNSAVNQSDVAYLTNYLFSGGPPPQPPFPSCDRDPPSQLGAFPPVVDPLTCFASPCPD
jgi:hypothetical protein